MKRRFLFKVGLAVLVVLNAMGCASAGRTVRKTLVFRVEGTAFLEPAQPEPRVPAAGLLTVVEATGKGLPAADETCPVARELTAVEAATYDALANLAVKVQGVKVRRQIEVENLQFARQHLEGELSGELTGVSVREVNYDPETGLATVKATVAVDQKGQLVPVQMLPVAPVSLAARRVRAEAAARLDALSKLREAIGKTYLTKHVRIKNLVMAEQRASLAVEGILEGCEFSEPRWVNERQCKVEATLSVTPEQLARLRAMVPSEP